MSASSKKKLRKEQAAEGLTEKQRAEQKEARKLRAYTISFVVVVVLAVVIALGTVIGRNIATSGFSERNTTAVTIGDHTLSNAELSYYYIDSVNNAYSNWYQTYGDYTNLYLQMMAGLDLTQPLSSQVYDEETGETWADSFVQSAINNAKSTYALCDEAAANGFTLSEDEQEGIDSTIENIRLYASIYGYSDLTAYLKAMYGYGATEESFRDYCEATTLAAAYQTSYNDSLAYDDAAIRAYDAEHEKEYNSYSYASYYLAASKFLEGGTIDENDTVTYSDEEKAASVAAAKETADSLLDASSITDLDKAIARLSINSDEADAASTKSENVLYSSVNSTLRDWVTDSSRKAGDMTVIANETTSTDEEGNETTKTNGYYVVYFEGSQDNTMALANVRHILIGFEGGTQDSSGNTTYSDEEKQAAMDKATELLEEWKSGEATEDSFAALAEENSTDTGSKSNGGLYEDIYPGQMVTTFNDWCFDESRKVGDTGIVETEYGCHIMYYVGDSDINYRDYMITNQLRSDDLSAWYNALVDAMTVTEGNTSKLNRDIILSSGS